MAFVLNDRVKETTTTTGTGTVNLAGAETGFESFVSGIGNSNTCYYAIVHQTADEFEVGLGTITDATPDTLARTTVISSSNSDSAVNFSAGTKDVFCTLPASKATARDSNDNITFADNDKILFGAGTDLAIFSDGTDGKIETTGDLRLDIDGEHIHLFDGGVHKGKIALDSAGIVHTVVPSNEDFFINGNDDGTSITAIRVDMSDAGRILAYGGVNIEANTDISFTQGTWTGEKSFKIQAHSGNLYLQSDYFFFRDAGGANNASIDSSGNAIFLNNVTAYGTPSDIKLKENIEVIDNALDKVKQLKGITYTLKSDGNRLTGLIAQDLEKVLPEAVYTSETIPDEINGIEAEEHLAIRYGNTVGLLVEAIKELEARVKELEDR